MASAQISDRTLDQAYNLALYIVPDETVAEQIVREALTKLEVTAGAQHKRSYYRPRSGVARTKVEFSPLHLLQRLIYIESEKFERAREASEATNRDFIVSFLKHLVRCAIKRNSFYAAIAISRVLHNYTTVECMSIYNLLIQDPDQYKEEDYYRSRKAVLMDEVEERFADRVQLCKGTRSEERFETQPTTEELVQLVRESLSRFTPWETDCLVPDRFDPLQEELEMFKDAGRNASAVELHRFHALLHPTCLGQIARNLELDDTPRRLEIPRFLVTKDVNMNDHQSRTKNNSYDSSAIRERVRAANMSRCSVSPRQLNIWVDGKLAGVLDVREQTEVTLKLQESAEIIEVRTTKEDGDALLAVHLLDSNAPQLVEMDLPKGHTVQFRTQLEENGIICEVRLEHTSLMHKFAGAWQGWRSSESSTRAWKVALPTVLALGIFVVLWNYPLRHAANSSPIALNSQPNANQSAKIAPEAGQNHVHGSLNNEEAIDSAQMTRSMDTAAPLELKNVSKIALDLPPDTETPKASFSGITITQDINEAEALLRVRPDESGKRLVSELRNEKGKLLWITSASCKASEDDAQPDCKVPATRVRTVETLLRRLTDAIAKAQR